MTCHSARELIPTLLDRELDPSRIGDVERHLEGCMGCTRLHDELSELRRTIQSGAPYYSAPAGLESRIKTALRYSTPEKSSRRVPWGWAAAAAAMALAAVLLLAIYIRTAHISERDLLADEVVSSHLRSLMATHLMDVPSSDRHTVKPWFAGKLDFSPQVKDLTTQGFLLKGGRLDYIDNRPVAAIVFQRREHIINLFVWPARSASGKLAGNLLIRGFNIVAWEDSGLAYWAVSDLNAQELREFRELYSK